MLSISQVCKLLKLNNCENCENLGIISLWEQIRLRWLCTRQPRIDRQPCIFSSNNSNTELASHLEPSYVISVNILNNRKMENSRKIALSIFFYFSYFEMCQQREIALILKNLSTKSTNLWATSEQYKAISVYKDVIYQSNFVLVVQNGAYMELGSGTSTNVISHSYWSYCSSTNLKIK